MRKICILFTILLAGAALAGPKDAPVINPMELKNGVPPTGVVISIPKGKELSVKVSLDGELSEAKSEPMKLTFKKELFVYLPAKDGEDLLYSWDREEWKSWKKMFSGSVSLGLKEPGTLMSIDLILNGKTP